MTSAPHRRSMIAMAALLAGLAIYSLAVMQLGAAIADNSVWLQTPVYLVLGVIWIWPARALLRWAAAGRVRDSEGAGGTND